MSFSDPDFVSSFDIGDKVYFFFRETAVEHINCGKVRIKNKSFEYVLRWVLVLDNGKSNIGFLV